MKQNYKQEFKKSLIYALLQIVAGILCFFIPLENAVRFFLIMFGIMLIIIGVLRLLVNMNAKNSVIGRFNLISGSIYLLLGVCLTFFSGIVISSVTLVFLLILPLVRIILSENKLSTFKDEIFIMAIGVIIFLCGLEDVLKYLRYVAGSLIILFAFYNLINAYLVYKKERNLDNVLDAKIKDLD